MRLPPSKSLPCEEETKSSQLIAFEEGALLENRFLRLLTISVVLVAITLTVIARSFPDTTGPLEWWKGGLSFLSAFLFAGATCGLLWRVHRGRAIRTLSLVAGVCLILSQVINLTGMVDSLASIPLIGTESAWQNTLEDSLIWSGMFLLLTAFFFSTVDANAAKMMLAREHEELKKEIADRVASQELLRKNQAILTRSQEIAHLGSWEWDFESESFIVSDEALRIFGLPLHERSMNLGSEMEKRIHPDDRDRVRRAREIAIKDLNLQPIEYRVVLPDASIRHIESEGIVLFNRDGTPARLIATVLDVTERIRTQDEREELISQIQGAQKLESLGVFAAGVAHDFNNILLTILGNADLVLSELEPDGWPCQMVKEIQVAGERMTDLCNQMLAFSGKGQFLTETVDISRVIGDIDQVLRILVSSNSNLLFFFEEELPPVEGESHQIQQAIVNLVSNASDSVRESGGTVSVRTGKMHCSRSYLAEAYYSGSYTEGDYVFVEISDNGVGMDRETQSRMFDPFFTTKEKARGLGLSAALGIVRGHHGVVKVSSEKGYGTTIILLFPISEKPLPTLATSRTFDPAWKGSGNVLVIDDEASVRNTATAMLFRSGFDVTTAASGKEGVQIFEENPDRFEIVLLDWTMPGMDGVQTFEEIREIDPQSKVIFTSGFPQKEAMVNLKGMGASGFIHKPYTYRELIAVMRQALDERATSIST